MPGPVAYDSHHHHHHPHQSQDDKGIDSEGVSPTEVLLTTDFWTIFTVEDLRISSRQAIMDSVEDDGGGSKAPPPQSQLAFFSLIVCQSTNETATFFSACHLLTNVFIHANQHCAAFLLLLLLFLGALIASVVLLCLKVFCSKKIRRCFRSCCCCGGGGGGGDQFDFDFDSDSSADADADDYNHSSATPLNIVIEVNAVPAPLLAPLPPPPTTFTTITTGAIAPLNTERFFESSKISDQSQPVLQNEAQKSPGEKVDRNIDPETAEVEINNQQQHSPADYSQLLEKVVASLLKENASKSIYSGSLLLSSDHLGDLLSESCIRLPHSKYFYTNNTVNNVDNNHHFESAQQLTESQVKAALEQCYALAAAAKGAKGSAAAAAESTESTAALSAESKQQQNQEESSEAAVIPPPAHSLPANMVLQRFGHQLQRPGKRKTSQLQAHSTLLSPLLLPPPRPPNPAEASCSPSSCDSPPPLQSRWLVRRWHYRGTGK